MGRIHKKYYSANATFLSDEVIQEIKGSIGVVPDAINIMAKKYHISHSRVVDYIENRECQQQINSRLRIESEVLLQNKSLDDSLNHSSLNLHLTSTTFNTETKKRKSKSQTKSVLYNKLLQSDSLSHELHSHISDSTPTNNSNETEKISSNDLVALREKEARRDEKNKANMTRLLGTI
ncbi:1318_t:CDS:1 [Ambispora gerdemannii]|uniref:1318_t:CDS:1 n=1 Tax=Ambispora gerdemannii TaxID=144530 RepID=A0A9N9DZS2_9GLOM|nr:1318_t:CDS:1 [Ambispora gerdemannii]